MDSDLCPESRLEANDRCAWVGIEDQVLTAYAKIEHYSIA
jgi:hypothetical protein